MRSISRKFIQKVASGVELILSAFLTIVIIVLSLKLIGQSYTNILDKKLELEYYLEYAMTLAIGIEFVKMLCTHTPGTIIEVLLFAISRQMIIEHSISRIMRIFCQNHILVTPIMRLRNTASIHVNISRCVHKYCHAPLY